jgi:phosphoribosylanthranilate isomerase
VFTVKICGVTLLADGLVVAEAGGDAVGFNFYPKSDRYIEPQAARGIARDLATSVWRVGVFVNASSSSICQVCGQVGLDCVQLHGDEPSAILADLPETVAVIRAFRMGADGLAGAAAFLRDCERIGRLPDAVLVDAQVRGAFGGTGRMVDWKELAGQKAQLGRTPLILAGGLTPENVRSAIEAVRPSGVDTASGVEVSPGVKDHEKVRRFIRESLASLTSPNVNPATQP